MFVEVVHAVTEERALTNQLACLVGHLGIRVAIYAARVEGLHDARLSGEVLVVDARVHDERPPGDGLKNERDRLDLARRTAEIDPESSIAHGNAVVALLAVASPLFAGDRPGNPIASEKGELRHSPILKQDTVIRSGQSIGLREAIRIDPLGEILHVSPLGGLDEVRRLLS